MALAGLIGNSCVQLIIVITGQGGFAFRQMQGQLETETSLCIGLNRIFQNIFCRLICEAPPKIIRAKCGFIFHFCMLHRHPCIALCHPFNANGVTIGIVLLIRSECHIEVGTLIFVNHNRTYVIVIHRNTVFTCLAFFRKVYRRLCRSIIISA